LRNKLLEEMGNSPEAMVEIENLVNEYTKQLLEELQASIDNDDKSAAQIDVNVMLKVMLDITNEVKDKEIKPLNELIQNES